MKPNLLIGLMALALPLGTNSLPAGYNVKDSPVCDDVKNKEMAFRTRRKGDGNPIMQSRYCRCSDLKDLPSPRFVSKQKF